MCKQSRAQVSLRLLSLTVLMLFGCRAASAVPLSSDIDRAMFIGLNYAGVVGVQKLDYAVADAVALSRLAAEIGIKDVVLLTDSDNAQVPTVETLLRGIESFTRRASPGEIVMLCLSGHGTEEAGRSYFISGDGGKVPISDIRELLASCKADSRILMVDACHSGGKALFPSGLGAVFFREITADAVPTVPNLITISACDVGEVAYEEVIDGRGHGVFTHFVLKGLRDRSAAIDNHKEVRLLGLYSYLSKTVGEWKGGRQHPRLLANGFDLVLTRYPTNPEGSAWQREVPFATFPIYLDKGSPYNHYYPSGWMGDWEDLAIDDGFGDEPYSGSTCVRVKYSAATEQGKSWAGIYWQDPDGNWGDKVGGFDLTGARTVTFVAKGHRGGEIAEFKVGGIAGVVSRDSIRPPATTGMLVLNDHWTRYAIDISARDTTSVIGGFACVFEAKQNPEGCTVYLDDIQIEGEFKQRDVATLRVDLSAPTWAVTEPGATGYMLLSRGSDRFRARLSLSGMEPNASYLLTLNGKVGDAGNELLKLPPGKTTAGGEGYRDVAQVTADREGKVLRDIESVLPAGEYGVKIFVKRMGTWDIVLYNDLATFRVQH